MIPSLSIIITTTDDNTYLAEALASALGQTESNIEVICAGLAEPLPVSDRRLRFLSAQTLSEARTRALAIARGPYCLFMRAENILSLNMAEKVLLRAKETEADLIVFDAGSFDSDTGAYSERLFLKKDTYPKGRSFARGAVDPHRLMIFSGFVADNKVFRRDLLEKCGFLRPDADLGADMPMTTLPVVMSERIAVIEEDLLYRRSSKQPALHSVVSCLTQTSTVYRMLEAHNALEISEQSRQARMLYSLYYNITPVTSTARLMADAEAILSNEIMQMGVFDKDSAFYGPYAFMYEFLSGVLFHALPLWRAMQTAKSASPVILQRSGAETPRLTVITEDPAYAANADTEVLLLSDTLPDRPGITVLNPGTTDRAASLGHAAANARGNYIAPDTTSSETLDCLLKSAEEADADIALCCPEAAGSLLTGPEAAAFMAKRRPFSLQGCVIRRTLVDPEPFLNPAGAVCLVKALRKANRVILIPGEKIEPGETPRDLMSAYTALRLWQELTAFAGTLPDDGETPIITAAQTIIARAKSVYGDLDRSAQAALYALPPAQRLIFDTVIGYENTVRDLRKQLGGAKWQASHRQETIKALQTERAELRKQLSSLNWLAEHRKSDILALQDERTALKARLTHLEAQAAAAADKKE